MSNTMRMKRHLWIVGFVGIVALARAEVRYQVAYVTEPSQLQITMDVPAKGAATDLQIPNWAPGAYVLSNFRDQIQEVAAADPAGKVLAVTKPDANTWRVASAGLNQVRVTYRVTARAQDDIVHYSGPSTYLYVAGRKTEPCRLELKVPADWDVAVGLDEIRGSRFAYSAPDYDTLADNPVTAGKFLKDTYTVLGKPHIIAYRGSARFDIDRDRVIQACRFVTESQTAFFGGAPYNKYVWHFSVNDAVDGAGGLEHLSSTQIGLSSGVGPRAVSVLAHEFFHLWNVKRIRSKALGPFDYLNLPKTGALWWLEGVTDYYASLLNSRYGWDSEEDFYRDVMRNLNSARGNAARMEISVYDASLRVGEAAGGRGNSNGLKISYYTFGWLAGMALDVEIRHRTGGKKSLDDVARDLWAMCKDMKKPGFEEDAIRSLCIKHAGPGIATFFDQVVMKPGDPPIEAQLAKMGLQVVEVSTTLADVGFATAIDREMGAFRVSRVAGPAEGKLMPDDRILKIDGKWATGNSNMRASKAYAAASEAIKPGKAVRFTVMRGTGVLDVEIVPGSQVRTEKVVREMAGATGEQRALRRGWIRG